MATAIETIGTNPPNATILAFLEVGGRLMVNPKGVLETGMDLDRILGPRSTAGEARRGMIAARRLHRRLRDQRFVWTIKCCVIQHGQREPNGWIVMEGER